jgi:hypothetical protein
VGVGTIFPVGTQIHEFTAHTLTTNSTDKNHGVVTVKACNVISLTGISASWIISTRYQSDVSSVFTVQTYP